MKKINKLLLPLTMILAMGVGVFSVSINSKKTLNEVEASSDTPVNGVFAKVTSEESIHDGDTIYLVSDDGYALRDVGGNPAFLYGTNESVSVSDDNILVHFNNAYVTPLTVTYDSVKDEYLFYGSYKRYSSTTITGYLAYDCRGCGRSGAEHEGANDYAGTNAYIGYWYNGCGLRKYDVPQSRWKLKYEDNNMIIQNASSESILGWTTGYSECFTFTGYSNINVYKPATILSTVVKTQPTKSYANGYHYKVGDELDLSGMVVTVRLDNGSDVDISYDDNPGLFTHYPYVNGTGNPVNNEVSITYAGGESNFYVSLIIDSGHGYYYRANNQLFDPRGSYMFVADLGDGDYRALSFNEEEEVESKQSGLQKVTILDGDAIDCVALICKIDIVLVNGDYYLKSFNKYLKSDESNFIVASDTPVEPIQVDYDNVNNRSIIKLKNTNKVLGRGGMQNFRFNESCAGDPAMIYKLEYDTSELNPFLAEFKALVSYCDDQGDVNFIDNHESGWNVQVIAYTQLSIAGKAYLHNITYRHGQETKDSIEDLIDRYDYIVSKYGASDFMERTTMGAYQNNYQSSAIITPTISYSSDNSVLIIVIASIGLLSVGGLIVYFKKRKHE